MTNKTTKGLAAAPKRTVKKAKLTAGIELSDNPVLSADELQAQIRRRAYELFLQRSPEAGNAETDWLQAEYEVTTAMLNTITTALAKKAKAPRTVRARSSPPTGSATQTTTRTRRKQPPASSKS